MLRSGRMQLQFVERGVHERELAAARKQLGDAGFRRHFAEGQTLTPDEAVEYALSTGVAAVAASSLTARFPS
jgi:methylmalonyl-CoA mutase cobalamin-binding subunit